MDNYEIGKLVQTILYKGVEFQVINRPKVIWIGCVDYAANNQDESDIRATLERYQKLVDVPKQELIHPNWSAAISLNYNFADTPCGIMFAQETYTEQQDERYDLFTQLGGLWLRVRTNNTAEQLFGRKNAETYEYFAGEQAPLLCAAKENGYMPNPAVHVQVEYHCLPSGTSPHARPAHFHPGCCIRQLPSR